MKRQYDPTQGIQQFILGVYAYWMDKGMTKKASQKRMIKSTYEALRSILSQQQDSDALFVEHARQFQLILSTRGRYITKEAEALSEPTKEQITQLTQLRELDSSLTSFIEKYNKGSDLNGSSN